MIRYAMNTDIIALRPVRVRAMLIAACLAAGSHAAFTYGKLPERVPTHFAGTGAADAWGSRDQLILIYLLTTLGLGAMHLVIDLLLPRMPPRWINLPHRRYYLAPGRRAESLAYMRNWLLWFATGSIAWMMAIFHLVFRVALGLADRLEHIWPLLILYLLACAAGTISMLRRFSRPTKDDASVAPS